MDQITYVELSFSFVNVLGIREKNNVAARKHSFDWIWIRIDEIKRHYSESSSFQKLNRSFNRKIQPLADINGRKRNFKSFRWLIVLSNSKYQNISIINLTKRYRIKEKLWIDERQWYTHQWEWQLEEIEYGQNGMYQTEKKQLDLYRIFQRKVSVRLLGVLMKMSFASSVGWKATFRWNSIWIHLRGWNF